MEIIQLIFICPKLKRFSQNVSLSQFIMCHKIVVLNQFIPKSMTSPKDGLALNRPLSNFKPKLMLGGFQKSKIDNYLN